MKYRKGDKVYIKDMSYAHIISGMENGAKISKDTCLSIYSDYNKGRMSCKDIGLKYNVAPSLVSKIVNHKHWSTKK